MSDPEIDETHVTPSSEDLSQGIPESSTRLGRIGRRVWSEIGYRALFILLGLIGWQITAVYITDGLLPVPGAVFSEIVEIVVSGEFGFHMANTLRRVLIGFFAAWGIAVFVGILMGTSKRLEEFFDMGVIIGLTIPGLAWAIIGIMIWGLDPIAAYFAVFIVVLPILTINIWQGVKDFDHQLTDVAEVFNFSRFTTFRHIMIPQLYPYMFSAGRFGLGLSWKVVVVIEYVGFSNGIGYMFSTKYNEFAMAAVFAWVGTFAILMLAIEYGVFKVLEWKLLDWKPDSKVAQRRTH